MFVNLNDHLWLKLEKLFVAVNLASFQEFNIRSHPYARCLISGYVVASLLYCCNEKHFLWIRSCLPEIHLRSVYHWSLDGDYFNWNNFQPVNYVEMLNPELYICVLWSMMQNVEFYILSGTLGSHMVYRSPNLGFLKLTRRGEERPSGEKAPNSLRASQIPKQFNKYYIQKKAVELWGYLLW